MHQRILVVCVGNICRSPMAEVLFRYHLPDAVVASAGMAALSGQSMDPTARAVLDRHGQDGSRHVARQLYDALVVDADVVLVMEQVHADALRQQSPHAAGRIFLLSHWQQQQDIPDPFGQPRPVFEQVYRMIDTAVMSWIPHLAPGRASVPFSRIHSGPPGRT